MLLLHRLGADLSYSIRSFVRTPLPTLSILTAIALGAGSNLAVQGFASGLTSGAYEGVVCFAASPEVNRALSIPAVAGLFEWTGSARITQAVLQPIGQQPGPVNVARMSSEVARLSLGTESTNDDGKGWILARLRPGVTESSAAAAFARNGVPPGVRIVPYTGHPPETATGLERVGTLLRLASIALFLASCANLISILLGRMQSRARDNSLRVALGAQRWQIARGLLADSLVISIAGGTLAVLVSLWTRQLFPVLLYEQDASLLHYAPNPWQTTAAAALCILILLVCGLAPAFAVNQNQPATVLRREIAGPSRNVRRLGELLVIVQVSISCALLISTAMLLDGFRDAKRVGGVGRKLANPALVSVEASPMHGMHYFRSVEQTLREARRDWHPIAWAGRLPGGYPTLRTFRIEPRNAQSREVVLQASSFTPEALKWFRFPMVAGRMFGLQDSACDAAIVNASAAEKLLGKQTPGIVMSNIATRRSVVIIGVVDEIRPGPQTPSIYFYSGGNTAALSARSQAASFVAPIEDSPVLAELDVNVVSATYLDAIGASVIAGRAFSGGGASPCPIAIVNQEAAEQHFGTADAAVGAAIIDSAGNRFSIVGTVRTPAIGAFQRTALPSVYLPMEQDWIPRMTLLLDVPEPSDPVLNSIERLVNDIPGRRGPPIVKTLETHLNQTALSPVRIAAAVLAMLAGIAMVLTWIGLAGAVADAGRRREREFAMRAAMGAPRWRLALLILSGGARLGATGALLSLPLVFWLIRFLRSIAAPLGSGPSLWVWLVAPSVLTGVALAASIIPALRVLRAEPIAILRDFAN